MTFLDFFKINEKRTPLWQTLLITIFLAAVAAFFRFHLIKEYPCGLFPDQALNGLDALKISDGVYSPVYGNREGLFLYLIALSHFFFGTGIWQIFIVSATIGTITIATSYLAIKEIFNKRIAFISAFLIAVSSWHTALSRNGFRAILVPLIISLFALFLFKSIKSKTTLKKSIYYSLTGIFFALGFYTYNAFVIFGFGILLISIFFIILKRKKLFKFLKKSFIPLSIAFIFSFLTIAPIALFILIFPDQYFARAGEVSVFAQSSTFIELIKNITINFYETTIGIFTHGDLNWRHNPAGKPLLDTILIPFFILGLIYSIIKDNKHRVLVFIFLIMFLPAILTKEGIPPHSLRLIGIIPAFFIFPAIGFNWSLHKLKNKCLRSSATAIITILLIIVSYNGYRNYFRGVQNSPHFYQDFRCDFTNVADYIFYNARGLIIMDDFSAKTLEYIRYPMETSYVTPEQYIRSFNSPKRPSHQRLFVPNCYGEYYPQVIELLKSVSTDIQIHRNDFGQIEYHTFEY